MNVWVVVKGEYEDAEVVGILTNQSEVDKLVGATRHLVFQDAITVRGPFQPGSIQSWTPQAVEPADTDVEWVCRVAGCNDC